ncbi:substrate-binding periplasmic protein [Bowmanella pacifica]|uniref:Solute-binding protein family 3/N-terminal domain-containing protein n=1 Tax=Bowmanella pacifica TaxID=502051 RepID=A0A918DKH7_9ALTE|nr:transporter substrate-binding domain-containing protein [Bowmanella pacifica]GGO70098.1 hypothetical protein GCM10010982_22800 [Bowmanella pacifica]
MRFISVFIFSLACFGMQVNAKELLRSSVSPEFADGLHAKYLDYIAKQMDMDLEINPMPFARRLMALKNGDIDLMVGVTRDSDKQDEVIYLSPSYEQLRHTYFVRKNNQKTLATIDDLGNMKIGVTIYAKYFDNFERKQDFALVGVSTLQQKIQLLMKGRIDTFIHYQESTLPLLEKMGLSQEVVKAKYQPTHYNDYFVTISANSRLLHLKDKFEQVIKHGVDSGEFTKIRETHYQQQAE